MSARSSRVLIAGCGFLGAATARHFHESGACVLGCTHSAASAAALATEPFEVVACDITDPSSVAELASAREFEIIVHCASSGRGDADAYRRIYLEGTRNLAAASPRARLIFVSSTSVYAQTDGSIVTEESRAEPQRDTGRILREAEDVALASGGAVARLAGLYGPGRSVLLQRFFSGEAKIEGDGGRFVNQIHRADAASAILSVTQVSDLWGNARVDGVFSADEAAQVGDLCHARIFNIADDSPLPQREIYERLARRFARPLPPTGPIDPNRKRGWTNKRVSNAKLRGLGWQPRFPSFFDAVENDPALLHSLPA